jgi:probable F420-dependent oxidoreductase
LGDSLSEAAARAEQAEAMGFDGAWTSETQHDAFLPLTLAAEHTTRLALGTSIAVAFPRSPMTMAHIAWDLQRFSGGRFILGLGTQVKGHIERRYGLTWDSPGPRLRDYIQALRAIWDCWQRGTPLNYRGEF